MFQGWLRKKEAISSVASTTAWNLHQGLTLVLYFLKVLNVPAWHSRTILSKADRRPWRNVSAICTISNNRVKLATWWDRRWPKLYVAFVLLVKSPTLILIQRSPPSPPSPRWRSLYTPQHSAFLRTLSEHLVTQQCIRLRWKWCTPTRQGLNQKGRGSRLSCGATEWVKWDAIVTQQGSDSAMSESEWASYGDTPTGNALVAIIRGFGSW